MEDVHRELRARALLDWYASNGRRLPWRNTRDPWAILVSEVMLQQTQAARVLPHFERFVARYPDPGALARAQPSDVLAQWSGLGYNRRALHLQQAARRIADHGWTSDARALEDLPGVGPYTAAAVACFAFGEQVPTVDTNLRRVLSRWHGRSLAGRDLIDVARRNLPLDGAADWNQAVMDLGALTCKPVEPSCAECPVAAWCSGPETYVAPRPQGRFEGTNRQARGAVIRELIGRGPSTVMELAKGTELDQQRVARALQTLAKHQMVEESGEGVFRLPDGWAT